MRETVPDPLIYKDLQKLLPDGSAHNCVANALEERLKGFEKLFYEAWAKMPD